MAPDPALPQEMEASKSHPFLILALFTIAVFTSALLLFAVQPLFARMVLPRLGGSPSVWSVAMVFFQTMLLAGYAYAHYLMRHANRKFAVGIHLALLIAAAVTLPLSIASGWGNPPASGAALWLLGLFTISIGLPFFALSANNPLLQAWFVGTGHKDGKDPYFLYAASNIGSFLALLSYPVLLEPAFTLREQNVYWSFGFGILFLLIAACAYFLLRAPAPAERMEAAKASAEPAPGWSTLGRWVFLSAVPSGLLVAVTAHISTDVAAVPLLWVIPLSLYLLTWVIAFHRRSLRAQSRLLWLLMWLQPLALFALIAIMVMSSENSLAITLSVHLIAFFLIAMAAHGELARQRPASEHLTQFYLMLSLGGMIGGLFAGLLAPYMFSWIAEYPILIALAALCRPAAMAARTMRDRIFWAAFAVAAVILVVPGAFKTGLPFELTSNIITFSVLAVALVSLLFVGDRWKFAAVIAMALVMVRAYPSDEGRSETVRSFFGVHKIYDTPDGDYRVLMHGTTVHGVQRLKDESDKPITGRPPLISYYSPGSPISQVIAAVRKRKGGPIRVAILGLGSGTIACHSMPGEDWKFFEIDQSVIDIAKDPKRFTFLQECGPKMPIVLGDGRLTFVNEPDGQYDLVVADAYSSDSLPVHLITREAMAVYKSKLAPDGVVLMHISNRHMALASVVVGIAAANGLQTWVYDKEEETERDEEYIFQSEVAIAAARPEAIGELAKNEDWELTEPTEGERVWSDDYSNVLGAILKKHE